MIHGEMDEMLMYERIRLLQSADLVLLKPWRSFSCHFQAGTEVFSADLMPRAWRDFAALPREDRACWVGGGAARANRKSVDPSPAARVELPAERVLPGGFLG